MGSPQSQLAADIATLRAEGEHDDAILKTYREYAPHHSADIDKLLGEGVGSKDLLDSIALYDAEFGTQRAPGNLVDNQGVLEKTGKALQYGASNAAVGLGRTADWVGRASGLEAARRVGAVLNDAGQAIAPVNYKPASQDFFDPLAKDKGAGGFGWGYLPRAIIEGAPGLAMDLGAGALTGGVGFVASNAARSFGPTMDARIANNGGKEATGTDYALAAGATALQAALSKVGINNAVSSVAKGAGLGAIAAIPGQVAKAGAIDGVSGVAGSAVQQAGDSIGTDKGLTISPHEALGSGALSGATAAGLRGVRGAGDINNAVKWADLDPQAAMRLADRMKATGATMPDDPSGAYRNVKLADANLKAAIEVHEPHVLKGADENTTRKLAEITSSLDGGHSVRPEDLTAVRGAIGDTDHGRGYIDALEERNVLNAVKAKSRVDDADKTISGGITSSPAFNDIANPLNWLKNPTQRTLGMLGAGIGLGNGALTAAHAATAGKMLAAQVGAMATARGIDGLLGNRNPIGEMTNRFSGMRERGVEASAAPMRQAFADAGTPLPAEKASGLFDVAQGRSLRPHEQTQVIDGVTRALETPAAARKARSEAELAKELELGMEMGLSRAEGPKGASGLPRASEKILPVAELASSRAKASDALKHYKVHEDLATEREPTKGKNDPLDHDENLLVIRAHGYEVQRGRNSVRNPKAYAQKTSQRMGKRAAFGDELEAVLGSEYRGEIRDLVDRLNNHADNSTDAYHLAENMFNNLPSDKIGTAFDVWIKHERDINATYSN